MMPDFSSSLAADGFPYPPHELHTLISGNPLLGAEDFLKIGKGCADLFRGILTRNRVDAERAGAILDFGCGVGRVIRHLNSVPDVKLYGTDINPTLINWCSTNLPFATFSVNAPSPPLTFPEQFFGLVYSFSVFTHLGPQQQLAWLWEFERILRPEGCALITTHGLTFLPKLGQNDRASFRAGELIVYNEHDAGNPDSYGQCNAFHSPEYVRGLALASGFQVLDYHPGEVVDAARGLYGQDAYLLRKSPAQIGLSAVPCLVPSTAGFGKTTVFWNTGSASTCQVYVQEDGQPEKLFADNSTRGAQEALWIGGRSVYSFRLYAGKSREQVLASVDVRQA